MNDKDIIKALELCINNDILEKNCDSCPYRQKCAMCMDDLMRDALDLINRLQAENERLRLEKPPIRVMLGNCLFYVSSEEEYAEAVTMIYASAITEFIDMLKKNYSQADILCPRKIVSLTEMELDSLANYVKRKGG